MSKVLERLTHHQFVDYSTTNNMLSGHQSENKKCHSTETLEILFTSYLYKAMHEKTVTAVVMLDLSKAFDSIDHHRRLGYSNRIPMQTFILPIMFLGKEFTVVDLVQDLGVIIDKHLSFHEHKDALASERIRKLAMISRIRHLYGRSTLLL